MPFKLLDIYYIAVVVCFLFHQCCYSEKTCIDLLDSEEIHTEGIDVIITECRNRISLNLIIRDYYSKVKIDYNCSNQTRNVVYNNQVENAEESFNFLLTEGSSCDVNACVRKYGQWYPLMKTVKCGINQQSSVLLVPPLLSESYIYNTDSLSTNTGLTLFSHIYVTSFKEILSTVHSSFVLVATKHYAKSSAGSSRSISSSQSTVTTTDVPVPNRNTVPQYAAIATCNLLILIGLILCGSACYHISKKRRKAYREKYYGENAFWASSLSGSVVTIYTDPVTSI